ncbi:hypothetical protein Tco_0203193, partial [Tanacetum coccineum]
MPMTWSPDVTLVSVKEKFCNVMKCLKIPSKFAKSLTCGASISWGRSRLHEGTNIYSWPSTNYQNGLKRNDRGTHFCNDQFAKVMLKYGVTRRLSTAYQMASLSRRLCGRETAHALIEKKGKVKNKYYGKLILDLGNEVRSSVEERTAAMENMVRKL